MTKVSWGVLSTAKIGVEKVIPAMQRGKYSVINAIASQDIEKAKRAANKLDIPKFFGSYEELLAYKEIDAIYIPLPNHLHVEWTIKSLEAGKHVLCEKPIGMDSREAEFLQKEAQKFPKLKLMEAFMYRHHPQINKAKELIDKGIIGKLRHIHSMFSYYNVNPADIRNKPDIGGGGLLDIGCYCISISRQFFNKEPKHVFGKIEIDPDMKIDRLVSAVMDFDNGTADFCCSTQLENHQTAEIFGTKGKIKIDFPFTPSPVAPVKIIFQSGSDVKEFTFDICNQYTLQGDVFSKSILDDSAVPVPFVDAVNNMKVIDKIKESSAANRWVEV